MARQGPTIYLETDDSGEIEIVLVIHAGEEQRLPRTTPEQDLVCAVELDYSVYRNEVHRLREEHPLFEEKPEVSSADYADLTAQVTRIAETMRELDPVAYFAITARLDLIRRAPDDGSAQYLLSNGSQQIYALEEPLHAQVRLRNIFDVTFDGMERATQRERYEKLRATYPDAVNRFCHARWMEEADCAPLSKRRLEYAMTSLEELRLLELTLYFQQDKRRIARCEYCWSYFVPKTSHATAYCDRVFDGKTCKKLGPNLKRFMGPEQDEALRLCALLHRRMLSRVNRYDGALESEQARRIKMDTHMFEAWSSLAKDARMAYMRHELTTEEFLRSIDVFHELDSYDVSAPKEPGKNIFQERGERSIDFDPEAAYQAVQVLDMRDPSVKPEWKTYSAEECRRWEQQGHESLREKYGEE